MPTSGRNISNAMENARSSDVALSFGVRPFTVDEQKIIQDTLRQKLGPSFISQRNGFSGQSFAYIPDWKIVSLANEIFGFNGWSYSFDNQSTDFIEENNGRYSVGVSTKVRVQLKDGTYREDIGFGCSECLKSKGHSIEKAKKDSITDGLKRALKRFGNALGNCISDKDYIQLIFKLKSSASEAKNDFLSPRQVEEEALEPPRRTRSKYPIRRKSSSSKSKKESDLSSSSLEVQIPTPPPSIATEEPSHSTVRPKSSANDSFPRADDEATTNGDRPSIPGLLSLAPKNKAAASPSASPAPNPLNNPQFYGFLSVSEMLGDDSVGARDAFGTASPKGKRKRSTSGDSGLTEEGKSEEESATVSESVSHHEWTEVIGEDDPAFWDDLMNQQQEEAKKEMEEQISTHLFAQSIGLVPTKPQKDSYMSSFSLSRASRSSFENPFCRDMPPSSSSHYSSFGTTEITSSYVNSHRSGGFEDTRSFNFSSRKIRVTNSNVSPMGLKSDSFQAILASDGVGPFTRSRRSLNLNRRSARLKALTAPPPKRAKGQSPKVSRAVPLKPKLRRPDRFGPSS